MGASVTASFRSGSSVHVVAHTVGPTFSRDVIEVSDILRYPKDVAP